MKYGLICQLYLNLSSHLSNIINSTWWKVQVKPLDFLFSRLFIIQMQEKKNMFKSNNTEINPPEFQAQSLSCMPYCHLEPEEHN